MTFKVKGGIQIGANVAFDSDGIIQQIESTPSIRPTVQFDFVRGRSVDSRLTFARSSNAVVQSSDGLLRAVTSNVPRIEYNANGDCQGLLIEYSSTNLIPGADQLFDTTYWPTGNVYVASTLATNGPDGNGPVYKIIEDTNLGEHPVRSSVINISTSTQYTYSIYAKAGERSKFDLLLGGASNWLNSQRTAGFDLSTGTIFAAPSAPATANIVSVGDGWYRCSLTATSNTATVAAQCTVRMYDNTPTGSYTGDGGSGFYLWGPQLEATSWPSSYIPASVTFTGRSSNGTYYAANGLLQTATSNVLRMSYNPNNPKADPKYLLEPAATNLLLYSEQFDAAGTWYLTGTPSAPTITTNATTAPDGTTTADLWTRTQTASSHSSQWVNKSAVATTYTYSMFVKKSVGDYVAIRMQGTYPARADARFNLLLGIVAPGSVVALSGFTNASATINALPNGWYRITLTATTDTNTQVGMHYSFLSMAGVIDSTDTASNSAGYVWGAQLEAGNAVTSYIQTVAATATRSADVYSAASSTSRATDLLSAPASSFELTPAEGTMFVDITIDGDTANNQYVFALGNGTTMNLTSVKFSGGYMQGHVYNAGNGQNAVSVYGLTNSNYKVAYAYSNTSALMSMNGAAVVAGTASGYGIAPYNTLSIGSGYDYLRRGYIRNISYYPHRLANTEMQSLTT